MATISITATNPDCLDSTTPVGIADLLASEYERLSPGDAYSLNSMEVLSDGSIGLSIDYRESGSCVARSVALVVVLAKRVYLVEGLTCVDEWEKYGPALEHAMNSFEPK